MNPGWFVALAATVAGGLAAGRAAAPATRPAPRPAPETVHWVLPVDRPAVEVAALHPGDCYVVRQAGGVAYFGDPPDAARALQRRLPPPAAHRVDQDRDQAACARGACVTLARIAAALERELAAVPPRARRRADHQPSPVDHWYGGAYTDVGSDHRDTYRNAPEQRMLFRHLATARRGNCYRATAPRTLTIHVRDGARRAPRTGVYHGLLYIEHHHPAIAGTAAAD